MMDLSFDNLWLWPQDVVQGLVCFLLFCLAICFAKAVQEINPRLRALRNAMMLAGIASGLGCGALLAVIMNSGGQP